MTLSEPVRARLAALRFQGELSESDAQAHGCRLITTTHGADRAPGHIVLSLLVDAAGVVADARHKSGAGDELLAAYDAMTEMLIGRPILEAARITPRAVEAFLRGSATEPAFPIGADADHAFYVIQKAIEACERPQPGPKTPDRLPWNEVGLFEKVRRIEAVLDQHVRPALAADGGGVDLVDLQGDELMIQYQGACGSCSSSIGGTLQFVQDAINNHLGTDLRIAVSGTETVESPLPI